MGLIRFIKVRMGFNSGGLAVVRIVKATDDELIFSNGMSVKVLDEWKSNMGFGRDVKSGKINYESIEPHGSGIYTILKHGRFTGIIVTVHENGDIYATHIVSGKSPIGWSGGNYIDYCKHIMASDFGIESEWLMSI